MFCPKSCECVTYAVICVDGKLNQWSSLSFHQFIVLYLTRSVLQNKLVIPFISKLYISHSNANFDSLCSWLIGANMLTYLSITFTQVNSLEHQCFQNVKYLENVELLNVNLQSVAQFVFSMLSHLIHVNMSNNPIKWISYKSFYCLPKLKILSLLNTTAFEVWSEPFAGVNFKVLETNILALCCFVPKGTECSLVVPNYFSCSELLLNFPVRVVCVVSSSLVLFRNVSSILTTTTRNRFNKKQNTRTFEFTIYFLNAADMSLSFPLLILWTANIVYKDNFAQKQELWQSSATCLLVFGLFLSTISVILISSNFMALSRLMVVKYPLESKFKDSNFVKRAAPLCFLGSISVSGMLSGVQWCLNIGMLSILCSPFFNPTKNNIFLKFLTWFLSVAHIGSIVAFCFCSCFLLLTLKRSQEQVRNMSAKKVAIQNVWIQLSILSISSFFCWGATGLILMASVVHSNFPMLVMFWTTVAVLPINPMMNPSVFILLFITKWFRS